MRRAALLLLLSASGCLTDCGAVSHGSVGHGGVGAGAIGGLPVASGCTVPGTPDMLFDADSIAAADATDVTTWSDEGAFGADATQATELNRPTLQKPCEGGGVLAESACLDFDGTDSLQTGSFTATTQPSIVLAVYAMDDDGSTLAVMDGDDVTNRQVIYQTAGKHNLFAGTNLVGAAVTIAEWVTVVGYFSGTSSTIRVNEAEVAATAGTKVIDGFTIGAFYGGTNDLDGRIALLIYYNDGSSVTAAELEAYALCRYGAFPQ